MKKTGHSTGVLLINLGTPASPSTADVRSYLDEFLMDRHVLDVPWPIRRLIVSAFILPFRPKASAHAYASIWTDAGSPLLIHSQALQAAMQQRSPRPVSLAMRYGEPSIQAAVKELADAGVDHLVVVPLYPQYADSTVTTIVEAVNKILPAAIRVEFLPPFYAHPAYRQALTASVKAHLPPDVDHLLMSYHGLPERHLTKADPTGAHCLQSESCCETASPAHATCYRHQVFVTSRNLAADLGIDAEHYSVSFQSRLGRLPWLTPYTDQVLAELPGRGVKNLAVVCPAFVADNLETLEEMGIQGRETFLEAGGEHFHLIPCLNDDVVWVDALSDMLEGVLAPQTETASLETSV